MSETTRAAAARAPARRTYRGSCECGAVLYEVELDLAPSVPAHSVWERTARRHALRLLAGSESLSGHQFSSDAHHFFCERCGVRLFSHHHPESARGFYALDLKSLQGPLTDGWPRNGPDPSGTRESRSTACRACCGRS